MVDINTLQILSGFEIFRGLTESDIEMLHAKCQGVKFKESEILMKEGQFRYLYHNQRAGGNLSS